MSRVVLVTGGASGIGWSVCRRFARSGDRVVLADLDHDAAQRRASELGDGALGIACDVSSPEAAEATRTACLVNFGRLDVLVNNAGIIDSVGTPAVETPLSDFRRLLGVNLLGAHALALHARAAMPDGGVIINVASAGGFVATPLRTAYGASKAGLISLTKALAQAWAEDRIRVNAVAPGYIRTPLIDDLITSGKVDPSRVDSRVPLGRMGRPEEIAEVIFHVASADAACLSGATVVADGGFLAAGGGGGPFRPPPRALPRTGGRTVVLTGADAALGGAVAAALIAAGDRVMLFGADEASLKAVHHELGPECRWMPGSSTDEGDVGRMAEAASAGGGPIAALVTLPIAAQLGSGGASAEAWQGIEDDLSAAFVADKLVGAHVLRGGGGAIVNVAPFQRTSQDTRSETSAGAIVMLTRSLACEWAGQNVRVNTVTGRGAPNVDHLVSTIGFLLSPAASYVTGAEFEAGDGVL